MKVKHISSWLIGRRKVILVSVAVVLATFVVVNLLALVIFQNRTYSKTYINGQDISFVSHDDVSKRLEEMDLLGKEIILRYADNNISTTPRGMGASYDVDAIRAQFSQRYWLPVANFLISKNVDLSIVVDGAKFNEELANLTKEFAKQPTNAAIVIGEDGFELLPATTGYEVDSSKTKLTFVSQLEKGDDTINVETEAIEPEVSDELLQEEFSQLQQRQSLEVKFTINGRTFSPSPVDIANWHTEINGKYEISNANLIRYIQSVGRNAGFAVGNTNQAVAAARNSLSTLQPANIHLIPAVSTTLVTYCLAAKGVSESYLSELAVKASAVYNDSRGWASTGKYSFRQADSGCSFILWLAAADQMTSFSTACSPYWSCRVGQNVIINIDRWQNATPAWNQAGGGLDDYRSMVINHETGHWLGFGHLNCSGVGQLAPVMQQQSIDLQGCTFNPWPLASELSWL